jgi:uncharacterized FlaG/YvyC family protein
MDISGVNRTSNVPLIPASATPPEVAAQNRSIVQAVNALNGTAMFGHDNQLTFHLDAVSKRMVIQMVNPITLEVVVQIPAEYLLRMAEDLKKKADSPPAAIG